jgi:hypothetical protein
MPGASTQTRQIKVLNANWAAGTAGEDGQFEIMIVTDDDAQHTIVPSPAAVPAILALARPQVILLWDPANKTIIAANIVGTWLTETPDGVTRA